MKLDWFTLASRKGFCTSKTAVNSELNPHRKQHSSTLNLVEKKLSLIVGGREVGYNIVCMCVSMCVCVCVYDHFFLCLCVPTSLRVCSHGLSLRAFYVCVSLMCVSETSVPVPIPALSAGGVGGRLVVLSQTEQTHAFLQEKPRSFVREQLTEFLNVV